LRRALSFAPRASFPASLLGYEILLAEDNDINALVVTRYLEKRGARIVRVRDGNAALAEARTAIEGTRKRFDAIILDIRMPELDGLEVARRISTAGANAHVPRARLIAVSADAFETVAQAARDAGIDLFLRKPVDLDRLSEELGARAGANNYAAGKASS
jgi:CheY-like chemotaxis protein